MKRGPAVRLLVLSLNYAPEQTGFSQHVAGLARHMVSKGHQVDVWTGFPFAPTWRRWPEYRGRLVSREDDSGVRVTRLTHYIPRQPRQAVRRMFMEASFSLALLATWVLSGGRRWDVVMYIGAQPSVSWVARIIAAWHRIPYTVGINDLASAAASDVGVVRSSTWVKFLEKVEYAGYLPAAGATVLCEGFREALVAHGYAPERIHVIRSPINTSAIRPNTDGSPFRAANGIGKDEFVVLWSGSMGVKQDLMTPVNAAALLRDTHPPVRWVFVGDGELKPQLLHAIQERKVSDRVTVLPLQPESGMSTMYGAADVLLLSQLQTMRNSVIPSKLLTYMAAGKPVLAAVDEESEGAAILRAVRGGVIVAPEDPRALAEGVLCLMNDDQHRIQAGNRNRRRAEEEFDSQRVWAQHEAFLAGVLETAGGGRA
jgi:colanic acid biosynthesis glycosyl transferase WcaI